jgi:hypothetical protein
VDIDPKTTDSAARGSASSDVTQGQPVVYTIPQFCRCHGISVAHYYALRKLGLGPREMVLGRRRLISIEAARDWRGARERGAS